MSTKHAQPPRLTNAETKQSYSDLDKLHQHSLLLIATTTQLGIDIKNVDLVKCVVGLPTFTDNCMKVTANLQRLVKALETIRAKDVAARTKRINGDNIMQILAISREYEEWVAVYQRDVGRYLTPALESLDAARVVLNAQKE